jgi:hypothetical protein
MRSLTAKGRNRLVAIAVVPAAAAMTVAIAACSQPAGAAPASAAAEHVPVVTTTTGAGAAGTGTAGTGAAGTGAAGTGAAGTGAAGTGWRVLARVRAAHDGFLDGLVSLPHARAWGFGGYGEVAPYTGHPLLEYWNGSAWTDATLPASSYDCGPIAGAGAAPVSNVWAVSLDGCVLRRIGSTWTVAKRWTDEGQLTGITVFGRNNVWVFGGSAAPAGRPGVGTWHYNGSTWQQVQGIASGVSVATAVNAEDIWAVAATRRSDKIDTVLVNYNGSSWQRISGVTKPVGVLASSSGQVWAVRNAGGTKYQLLRRTSSGGWTAVPVPDGLYPGLGDSDGQGGLWLTSFAGPVKSEHTVLLHLSATGQWSRTRFSNHDVSLDLALVPGTTSLLGLTDIGVDSVLYGYKVG